MGNHIEKDCRNCHLGNTVLMDCWGWMHGQSGSFTMAATDEL